MINNVTDLSFSWNQLWFCWWAGLDGFGWSLAGGWIQGWNREIRGSGSPQITFLLKPFLLNTTNSALCCQNCRQHIQSPLKARGSPDYMSIKDASRRRGTSVSVFTSCYLWFTFSSRRFLSVVFRQKGYLMIFSVGLSVIFSRKVVMEQILIKFSG